MKKASSEDDWVWSSYIDGHEPIPEPLDPQDPSAETDPKQDGPREFSTRPTDPKSTESRDPASGTTQESSTATPRQNSSTSNKQPSANPVRDRLTKLFEFLRAYVDLRFPPVRDITQQPRFLWLKDIPAHPSVELFRDAGKPNEEVENNDIILRLRRPAITRCPSPPPELADWLNPDWQELSINRCISNGYFVVAGVVSTYAKESNKEEAG